MSAAYEASNKASTKYQDLIARAVSRLPTAAPAMRRELYDRARAALKKQLEGLTPPLTAPLIEEEARALDLAIEVVESRAEKAASAAVEVARNPSYGWLANVLERASKDEAKTQTAPPSPPSDARTKSQTQTRKPFVPRLVSEKMSPFAVADRAAAKEALLKLQSLPGVEASALISSHGKMIASALSAGMEEARIARMGATLTNMAEKAARALERGDAREVIIHGQEGYAVLIRAGGAFLLSLANETSKLGAIFSCMYDAVEALGSEAAKDPASKEGPRRSA